MSDANVQYLPVCVTQAALRAGCRLVCRSTFPTAERRYVRGIIAVADAVGGRYACYAVPGDLLATKAGERCASVSEALEVARAYAQSVRWEDVGWEDVVSMALAEHRPDDGQWRETCRPA